MFVQVRENCCFDWQVVTVTRWGMPDLIAVIVKGYTATRVEYLAEIMVLGAKHASYRPDHVGGAWAFWEPNQNWPVLHHWVWDRATKESL